MPMNLWLGEPVQTPQLEPAVQLEPPEARDKAIIIVGRNGLEPASPNISELALIDCFNLLSPSSSSSSSFLSAEEFVTGQSQS